MTKWNDPESAPFNDLVQLAFVMPWNGDGLVPSVMSAYLGRDGVWRLVSGSKLVNSVPVAWAKHDAFPTGMLKDADVGKICDIFGKVAPL